MDFFVCVTEERMTVPKGGEKAPGEEHSLGSGTGLFLAFQGHVDEKQKHRTMLYQKHIKVMHH